MSHFDLNREQYALQQYAHAGEPAEDLRALGIDSPQRRWLAARNIIRKQNEFAIKLFERVWLVATFLDYAEANAMKRTDVEIDGEQITTSARDLMQAKYDVLKPYRGAARDAAEAIIDRYCPATVRQQEPSRVYREMQSQIDRDHKASLEVAHGGR